MSTISGFTSTTGLDASYAPGYQKNSGQSVGNAGATSTTHKSRNFSGTHHASAISSNPHVPTSDAVLPEPFGDNTQANADYRNMIGALQSGKFTTAQKEYTKLQTDLKVGAGGGTYSVPAQTNDSNADGASGASGSVLDVTV